MGRAVIGDPGFASNASAVTPYWIPASSNCNGGYARIRDAFVDLVARYGTPAANGAGIGQALAAQSPGDDILGNLRGAPPHDIGAVERDAGAGSDALFANGFE